MKGRTIREIISNNRGLKCLLNFIAYADGKYNKLVIGAVLLEIFVKVTYPLHGSFLLISIVTWGNIIFLCLLSLGKLFLGVRWVIGCCK